MSLLISGSISLGNGVSSGAVSFASPFAGTVPVVIPWVSNITGDDPKLLINAFTTFTDLNGFTFSLDATTNSANYKLNYYAGSPDSLYAALSLLGVRATEVDVFSGTPDDLDLVPLVRMTPRPRSAMMRVGGWRSIFLSLLGTAPASPDVTPAGSGRFFIDGNYLYVRHSSGVGRIGLATSAWAIGDRARKTIHASHQCTVGQNQTIVFASEFPAMPVVRWALRNTIDSAVMPLSGVITARATTGFTLTLSAVPTANYYIDYDASCAMP